jgi:hypothetical protein
MNEFAWLFDQNGIETLFDPPSRPSWSPSAASATRPSTSARSTSCDASTRSGGSRSSTPACRRRSPRAAREDDAISLDRVLARFQPTGPDAHLTRAETLKAHAGEIVAAIKAHVAEHTARHGALE